MPRAKPRDRSEEQTFSFLYSRESSEIGQGVPQPQNQLSELMEKETKADIIRTKGTGLYPSSEAPLTEQDIMGMSSERRIEDVEGYLNLVSYEPFIHKQHPRFSTTLNEIGSKPPNHATLTTKRYVCPGGFSKMYASNNKNRDSRLNTGITRSRIHSKLDQAIS